MRLFVKLYTSSDYHVVPFKEGDETVSCLLTEIAKRINGVDSSYHLQLVSAGGSAVLCPSDRVRDVLKDDDYLIVGPQLMDSAHCPNPTAHDEVILLHYNLANINSTAETIELDGCHLTIAQLMLIGDGKLKVKVSEDAIQKVAKARQLVDHVIAEKKVVYGISTGFGKFATTVISSDKIHELQENLIRSHAVGVGDPLTLRQCRMLLALRINVLVKGYSGIRVETLLKAVDALNASCLPLVPQKGTLGASGDLAPLSHLALGLMGEGQMWSAKTGWTNAATALAANSLKPITLEAKEGIALINGTQMITSLGAEAVYRAKNIARQADIVAALTLEVLRGSVAAYDPDVHSSRPHNGQQVVASRLRSLLHSDVHHSEISESHQPCNRVQDAYSLRCCPQVHGIAWDTIQFVEGIIATEMNSATDNPMIMAERNCTISCGNFHGEYPAKSLDYLAIGVHELSSLSERRIERLVHPAYSGLPAFLTEDGGLNSGLMIPQYTAAALVSENKVLTHPSSVDSQTTSAGTEDHVSMGGFAARKALTIVEHVEHVLGIELLAACQGMEFLRPLKSTPPLEAVYELVRSKVKPMKRDHYLAPDMLAVTELLQQGKVWEVAAPYMEEYNKHYNKR